MPPEASTLNTVNRKFYAKKIYFKFENTINTFKAFLDLYFYCTGIEPEKSLNVANLWLTIKDH